MDINIIGGIIAVLLIIGFVLNKKYSNKVTSNTKLYDKSQFGDSSGWELPSPIDLNEWGKK